MERKSDDSNNSTPRSISSSEDEASDYKSDYSDYNDEFDSIETKREKDEEDKFNTLTKSIVRTLSGKLKAKEKLDSINSITIPISDRIHKRIKNGIPPSKLSKILKKTKFVDQVDERGQSVLHLCASSFTYIEHMKVAIKRGANVNLQDNTGFTPIFCAVLANNLEGCLILLQHKNIDVKITNNEKSNVLHYLCRIPILEQNTINYRKVLDRLIEKGIDLNKLNRQGESPLHSACMKVNIPSVAFLIERGANVNIRTNTGETILHYATRTGNYKLFRLIMENGADPTIKSLHGETPADIAEQYRFTDILESLLWIMESRLRNFQSIKAEIIRMGVLEIFYEGSWCRCDCVITSVSFTCYENERERVIAVVNLYESLEIQCEEGTVMNNDSDLLWGFIVETKTESLFFASRDPRDRDSWMTTLSRVSSARRQYVELYERLKTHSHQKIQLRINNRKIARDNVNMGVQYMYDICKSKPNASTLIDSIISNLPRSSACLSELLDIDDEELIGSLVKVLVHRKSLIDFLKCAISYDIGKSKDGETLFREMSLSTRLLSCYLEGEEGKEFLKTTVHILVQAAYSLDTALEVNPNKFTDKGAHLNFQSNLEKVCEISQLFLDEVLCYPNRYPPAFREIMKHTKEVVDAVYSNMTHAVIGGFVFLRFLCPAIVSPHKYGLTSRPPDHKVLRTLILISKLLQSVSNGVEFDGSKEDYMKNLNPFIHRNRLHVGIFFDKLVDIQEKSEIRSYHVINKIEEFEGIVFKNVVQLVPKMWQMIEQCAQEEAESNGCEKEGINPDDLD